MRKKNLITPVFVLLTGINLLFFIFRNSFQYEKQASLSSLYSSCDQDCFNKWAQYIHDYPDSEFNHAKIISDSITASSKDVKEKLLALGSFLVRHFHSRLGRPSPSLLRASPLAQFRLLSASDTSQLWCGNFAEMFSFFCWSQGIVCRNVEIMNPGDRHVVNECYVEGNWVMVDLTSNFLFMVDEKDQPLGLAAFIDRIKNREPITIYTSNRDAVNTVLKYQLPYYYKSPWPYFSGQHPLMYYYRVNNEKIYSTTAKIFRYFLPVSWYEINGGKKHSNLPFYLKEVFSFLWVISFFVFLISRAKFKI
ncbi:MAG: transglutaminase domain-containing protein [Flavisolibacter sp.]